MREHLLHCADRSHPSILILLDLSAAFDTVDHHILLKRLHEVAGVSDLALAWFSSFLSGRSQSVKSGEYRSVDSPITCGVPQGSSLSPLLFNIYLRPLASVLEAFGLRFQMYADDTQILVDLDDSSGESDCLSPCLTIVQEWMRQNLLCLNGDKTEILMVHGRKGSEIPPFPWPSSWGPPPTPVIVTRDLGILLSNNLSGDAHASSVAKAGHFHLSTIAKLFPLLDPPQRIELYHALVASRLNYGAVSLLGASKKSLYKLQKVQNRAIRLIYSLPRRTRITPWRKMLGWLDIQSTVNMKTCLTMWKARAKIGPLYSHDWAILPTLLRPPRSILANLLKPVHVIKSTKGGRRLAFAGAQLWNKLPPTLRAITSFPQFKRELKIHLLSLDSVPTAKVKIKAHPIPTPVIDPLTVVDTLNPMPLLNFHPQTPRSDPASMSFPPQVLRPSHSPNVSRPHSSNITISTGLNHLGKPCWGFSSPPLPSRNNQHLIQLMAANKIKWQMLRDSRTLSSADI